jgi:DNA-binding GntR family transcriptional regulator
MDGRTDLDDIPGRQPTLAQRTAEVLRRRILSGQVAQGERINEARLAAELQTSRGPIREALRQLSAEGLLKDTPRRGSFVVTLSPQDVTEIYELRTALEMQAARTVINRGEAGDFKRLEEAVRAIEKAAATNDVEEVARLDLEFHQTLCRLSRNSRISALFQTNSALLRRLLLAANENTILREMFTDHRSILNEIEARNVTGAESAISDHLERGRVRAVRYLEALTVPESDRVAAH